MTGEPDAEGLETLLAVTLVAALAPIVVAALPGPKIPQVVVLILVGERRLQAAVRQGQRATAQTTLRWAIVLLLALLVLAERFGLDVVLGAMLAGMVLRSWTRAIDMDVERLEQKLDAVGYGIFIPLFFVCSGMTLDIHSIASDPVRLLVFAGLLLVVRGLPALLVYARFLPFRQRAEMTFITATTLPLLVALAEIGQHDGLATASGLLGTM